MFPQLHHEFRLEKRPRTVFAQQFDKPGQASLFVGSKMEMNVPAQIILAELEIIIGAAADNRIEGVQPEVARLTQEAAQVPIFDSPPQSPNRVDKRKLGLFVPGGAQVPKLMAVRAQQQIQGAIANQQGVVQHLRKIDRKSTRLNSSHPS